MGPKLCFTRDYSLFRMHLYNRPRHKDRILEESLRKFGFIPSSPIHCVRDKDGMLDIKRGHHRFYYAKKLDTGIWYVVDESNTDIFYLESGQGQWSIRDFAYARANAGDENCVKLLDFMKQHSLPLGAAASLIGGESAGNYNKSQQIRSGKFEVVENLKFANAVVSITDRCRELKIPFATARAFVTAIEPRREPTSTFL